MLSFFKNVYIFIWIKFVWIVKYCSTDSHAIVSGQKGLLNPYRLFLWGLITNERNTKIGAEQCAKDATLREIFLSVFENGVGATELHFT